MVLSIHGPFSARIVQAFYHKDHLEVRTSRLINLFSPYMSTDFALFVRWVKPQPTGKTVWDSKHEQRDERMVEDLSVSLRSLLYEPQAYINALA